MGSGRATRGPFVLGDEARRAVLAPLLCLKRSVASGVILLEGPVVTPELFLGPRLQTSLQDVPDVKSRLILTPCGTKNRGCLPYSLTAAQTISKAGFCVRQTHLWSSGMLWRSRENTRSFCWLKQAWPVKKLLIAEDDGSQRAVTKLPPKESGPCQSFALRCCAEQLPRLHPCTDGSVN